jgi:hypothetical protein
MVAVGFNPRITASTTAQRRGATHETARHHAASTRLKRRSATQSISNEWSVG